MGRDVGNKKAAPSENGAAFAVVEDLRGSAAVGQPDRAHEESWHMIAKSQDRAVVIVIPRMIPSASAAFVTILLTHGFQWHWLAGHHNRGSRCRFQLLMTMHSSFSKPGAVNSLAWKT